MSKFAAMAMIPLFAGFLWAQDQSTRTETHSTTTKTTYNGTLVDAACQSSHTEHHESRETTTNAAGQTTTRTESSHNEQVDCPVTTSTSSFGLLTSDGQFVRFDQPSNTRIVEVVKTNKKWSKAMSDRAPMRVSVVGAPNGDVVVLESIR